MASSCCPSSRPGLRFQSVELEPEQEDLLDALVEDARSVPRSDREDFVLISKEEAAFIHGPGGNREFPAFQPSDLHVLHNAGLIGVTRYTKSGGLTFYVAPEGFAHYEERKRQAGDPAQQVEKEIAKYLEASPFRAVYPAAYAKWAEAAELLWGSDSERQLTTIGHLTREAVQEFATALIERHQPPGAPPEPIKTVARLRALIEQQRSALGKGQVAALDALVVYWGTVSDLIQRQEHGGKKEGEALRWEDGRRVVFMTAVAMFEIAHAL